MTTRQIESGVQDRTVADYRNQWGFPLGINPMPSPWPFRLCVLVGLAATCAGYAVFR